MVSTYCAENINLLLVFFWGIFNDVVIYILKDLK
jgi:hypothetical protein